MAVHRFGGKREALAVLERLQRKTGLVVAGCLVALFGIFVVDLETPSADFLDPLYLVPTAAAAIALPARWALSILLGATTLQIVALRAQRASVVTVVVGGISLMLVFAIVRLLHVARANAQAQEARRRDLASLEDRLQPLTKREREVVQLVAEGRSAREIAARLSIGRRTVETHITRAYAKLGVESRVDLILKQNGHRPNGDRL